MNQEPLRILFGKELIRLADRYEYISVCADTKCCGFENFGDLYPRRQVTVGIAEQNLLGVAAGLASCGHKVILSTYGTFATMRACEQLRTYIAHPRLDVLILGSHSGLQGGEEGVSHTAVEDVAILRAIPHLSIIQPSDAISARVLAADALEFHGPLYVRLPFDVVENVDHPEKYHAEIGKASLLREGGDLTLITSGILLSVALRAAESLKTLGLRARVLEFHTIKPLDVEAVHRAARETGAILTIEDHSIIGGLGGAVAETIAVDFPVPMRMIGIQDRYAHSGEAEKLYEENGMTEQDIVAAAVELFEQKTRVTRTRRQ